MVDLASDDIGQEFWSFLAEHFFLQSNDSFDCTKTTRNSGMKTIKTYWHFRWDLTKKLLDRAGLKCHFVDVLDYL